MDKKYCVFKKYKFLTLFHLAVNKCSYAAALMVCIIGSLSYLPEAAFAGDFTPVEIMVTPNSIIDYEFDYANPRFAWTDFTDGGKLWIGFVDPVTGDFSPPDGKAVLVDTDTIYQGNGPEWAASLAGPILVYDKKFLNKRIGLAQATETADTWVVDAVDNGVRRINPVASLDPEDISPGILYLLRLGGGEHILACRVLDDPSSERQVPMSADATGGRCVPGSRAVVFSAPLQAGRQAFFYDCSTGEIEQLTFDSGRKQTVFMWRAPDFNNEYIFFTSVKFNEGSVIRLYAKQNGVWTVFKTIAPPEKGIFFWSPEPFVHNGKSYIVFVASRSRDHKASDVPTQIWLANIDTASPFIINLTTDPNRLRADPEVFVTDGGPFVYYNRDIPMTPTEPRIKEGIYRVDTGLGPVAYP